MTGSTGESAVSPEISLSFTVAPRYSIFCKERCDLHWQWPPTNDWSGRVKVHHPPSLSVEEVPGGRTLNKVTLLSGVLLALTASVASAGPGLNLRWQACLGDGGTSNRTSTCLSSVGFAGTLVGSFVLPGNIAGVTGIEVVLDLTSAGTALPAWWAFGTGGCRAGSLGANGLNSPTATCIDWAHGAGAGGFAGYQVGLGGPNTARVKLGFAVATPTNLLGAIEYFGFNALISNVRTTGATACAGCLTPVCLVFNSVNVVPGTNAGVVIFGPTNLTDSNFAVWQGGGGVGGPGGQGCPAATPTRKATWDSVKSLYR